ncbi:MAG: hypothetical protein K2X91_13260, partial [Thermoleophilia bacterium]|nr:hypothetical protein [Thermoleophilia bacterium]
MDVPSGDLRTALLDEPASGLRRDCGSPTVGVGADGLADLLVQGRATNEDDVVIADSPLLELLD